MKIVIDIDGTICDEDHLAISERQPFIDRINKINSLYDYGYEIVYYTSRGMRSCNDDAIAAERKYSEITKAQLEKWGAKYNKLIFGKPNADIYIDNKNVLLEEFFNKR